MNTGLVFIHTVFWTDLPRTHLIYEQRRHVVMLLHGGIVIGINLKTYNFPPPVPKTLSLMSWAQKSAGSKANPYKDKSNMIHV